MWEFAISSVKLIFSFLDSNFFFALVTIGVGTFAFRIYKNQKDDTKKDAANIILLEIQDAERKIRFIREILPPGEGGDLPEVVIVLPTSNWHSYKYLFVRDFDRDSWDMVNEFYNKCRLLDEALESNKSYFQKNEVELRANRARILMDYLREKINETDPTKKSEIETSRQQFISDSIDISVSYSPVKPVRDARKLLAELTNISQTIVGIKLRELAKM